MFLETFVKRRDFEKTAGRVLLAAAPGDPPRVDAAANALYLSGRGPVALCGVGFSTGF